jgi:hypothetical protein
LSHQRNSASTTYSVLNPFFFVKGKKIFFQPFIATPAARRECFNFMGFSSTYSENQIWATTNDLPIRWPDTHPDQIVDPWAIYSHSRPMPVATKTSVFLYNLLYLLINTDRY